MTQWLSSIDSIDLHQEKDVEAIGISTQIILQGIEIFLLLINFSGLSGFLPGFRFLYFWSKKSNTGKFLF